MEKISYKMWALLGNGWKYILNCIPWFTSNILNFNPLCNAYTFQRYYTVLLKNERIFGLILGRIFGNYFFNGFQKS